MKCFYYLPILCLLNLTGCAGTAWREIAIALFKTSGEILSDRVDWKNATPPERDWKLSTGEYPDPVTSTWLKQQYEEQKKAEKWQKEAEKHNGENSANSNQPH